MFVMLGDGGVVLIVYRASKALEVRSGVEAYT